MKLSRIELKTLMKNKMMAAGLSEPHAETTAEILTWSHERGWIIFFTVIAAGLGTILSLII